MAENRLKLQAPLNVNNEKVTKVGTPTENGDATNKAYVDDGLNKQVTAPLVAPTNNGEILIWDDTNQRWIVEDIDIVDTGGEDNLILNVSDANEALWPTTKRWQQAQFLEKVETLPLPANGGDSVYLIETDVLGNAPGPYTYIGGTTNAWTATGGGGTTGTSATFRTWTTTPQSYNIGDLVVFEGDHFIAIAAHTSGVANPFESPDLWSPLSSDGFDIDNLVSLGNINTAGVHGNVFPGDIANVINDGANNGLYLITSSDNQNRTAGTTYLSIAGLGVTEDPRFSGAVAGVVHINTGVTVQARLDTVDAVTDRDITIVLPSAVPTLPTTPFVVGDNISTSATGVSRTIIRIEQVEAGNELILDGHHASEFNNGDPLFRDAVGHKENSIWTLPAAGASAYEQDDETLNSLISTQHLLSQQVQANSTAIAAFDANLVSIAAYQPQGVYLSGAGGVTPSFSNDQVDRSGSATGTGYANTGEMKVYHDGRFEIISYLNMPNVDNAPDPAYVDAFEESFRLEDIIGFAFVSGAYNTLGFPHIINATLETKYDNGHGQGLKAYFLNGVYQGRVEVRFQGQLSAAQNNERSFITLHQDNTILYDTYTAYQIYPENEFWHNVRVADPEQIFLLKEGVFLLHELSDAATEANVGKYITVAQNLNFVDTFNYPAGTALSQNLSFFLSRPHNGDITISALPAGLTATVTGNEIDIDYTADVVAGSFTATYATTGIEAVDLPAPPSQTINVFHDITVTSNDVGYVRETGTFDYLEFTGSPALLVFLDALGFDTTAGSYTDIVFGHAITFTLDGHTFTLPDTAEYDYDTAQDRFVFDNASVTNRPAADLADGTLTTVAHDFEDSDIQTIRSGNGVTFDVNGTDLSIAAPARTVVSDNLIGGESLTIPGEHWVIVPNTVRYYLFYNHHGGPITIGPAPAAGWTLEEVAEQIIDNTALILINEDHLDMYPRAADPMDTDYSRPFRVVHGSTWYFEHNLWLYEGDADITVNSDALTFSTRPTDASADWVRLHNIAWNRHITYYENDLVGYGDPMVIYRATALVEGVDPATMTPYSPAGANFATLNPETQAGNPANQQWEVFSLGNSGDNRFTGDNTFTGTNIFTGTGNRFNSSLEIRENADDAAANPLLTLNRRSNSPEAADDLGIIEFQGSTQDGTNPVVDDFNYAVVGSEIIGPDTRNGGFFIKVANNNTEAADSSADNHFQIHGNATTEGAVATFADDVVVVMEDTRTNGESVVNNIDINGTFDVSGATFVGITETDVVGGTGVSVVDSTVDNVKTYTVEADVLLNRGEITIPGESDLVLRTGPTTNIAAFLATAAATTGAQAEAENSGNATLTNTEIGLFETAVSTTIVTDWTDVGIIRISLAGDDTAYLAGLEVGDDILLTFGTSTANWALFQVTTALTTFSGAQHIEVDLVDSGGAANTGVAVTMSKSAGAFIVENVLAFVDGDALTATPVMTLVQSGIETEVDGTNIDTTIGVRGTGATTATLHHAPANAMAYLAIQFGSEFKASLPAAYFMDAVTTGQDWTYIHYTSSYDGVEDVNYVDRVATVTATGVTTVTTRRFGTAALPATNTVLFDAATGTPAVDTYPILPQQ